MSTPGRRRFLTTIGAGIAALASAPRARGADRTADARRQRPNIIFIMSDDHCAQAIGAYGGRLAGLNPTPVIDRLAAEGMLLENAFCTNSICTPSRATIMTGQHSQTNGVLDLGGSLPPERHYLPIEMSKAGYETAMIGKWHLKEEPAHFDYYCVLPGQGKYFDPTFRLRGEGGWPNSTIQHEGHSSDVITDLSLDWLGNRDDSRPFFLMHHFKAPHDMFQYAPRYASYLDDVELPKPENLYERGDHGSVATRGEDDSLIHVIGSSVSKRNTRRNMGQHMKVDPDLPDREYTHQAYQRYLKAYLRCVKGVDDNVARLLDYLAQHGLLDDTVILYTGDQGFMLGEHDYIDKRWMYEESMRMPLLVRHPGRVEAGSRSDALINNTDFAPTMLELAGAGAPNYMQGRSFVPILEGRTPRSWRTSTYYRYWMHMAHGHANPAHFGIRTAEWKLIFFYGCDYRTRRDGKKPDPTPPGWELYNLKDDPQEMNNVYGDARYTRVVARLKAQLKRTRRQLNETDADYPETQQIIDAHWDD